jgi:hypothetical protein
MKVKRIVVGAPTALNCADFGAKVRKNQAFAGRFGHRETPVHLGGGEFRAALPAVRWLPRPGGILIRRWREQCYAASQAARPCCGTARNRRDRRERDFCPSHSPLDELRKTLGLPSEASECKRFPIVNYRRCRSLLFPVCGVE